MLLKISLLNTIFDYTVNPFRMINPIPIEHVFFKIVRNTCWQIINQCQNVRFHEIFNERSIFNSSGDNLKNVSSTFYLQLKSFTYFNFLCIRN